jgi:hypothetical protein
MTRRKPALPGEHVIRRRRQPASDLSVVTVYKATGGRVEIHRDLTEAEADAKYAELRVLYPAGRAGRGREGDKLTVRFPDDVRARIIKLASQRAVSEAQIVRDLVARALLMPQQ